jgi:hypothetical protein
MLPPATIRSAHAVPPGGLRARHVLTVVALGSVLPLAASLSAHASPAPVDKAVRQPLRLTFNDAAPMGASLTTLANSGSARLHIEVTAANGGTLTRGQSRAGGSSGAGRTPRHDASADAPRAVIAVVDEHGRDNLNPSTSNFTFGADVRLDKLSENDSAGSFDNGDNLVQRGLFDSDSQYKIQLDHDRATCRVRGADGAVSVSSRQPIKPATWYRVRCSRSLSAVSIAITWWDRDGVPTTVSNSATGETGNLRPDSRSVPLSIGGKLSPDGALVASTDQLNGRIDNVIVRIG